MKSDVNITDVVCEYYKDKIDRLNIYLNVSVLLGVFIIVSVLLFFINSEELSFSDDAFYFTFACSALFDYLIIVFFYFRKQEITQLLSNKPIDDELLKFIARHEFLKDAYKLAISSFIKDKIDKAAGGCFVSIYDLKKIQDSTYKELSYKEFLRGDGLSEILNFSEKN